MPPITGERTEGVQAVVLTLRILEHLGQAEQPLGVTAIANALGVNKSRIFRHLRTLCAEGYLLQCSETERYDVGAKFIRLGRAIADRQHIGEIAQPYLTTLRDRLGHFTVISEPEPEGIRITATLSGKSAIEIGVKHGSLLPFHTSAQGKIALAFGDDSVRHTVLKSRLERMTPKTITSAAALSRELERVRRQGWAVAPNEALIGINALAAPVYDEGRRLAAIVAIVDSIQFIAAVPSAEQVKETVNTAKLVSAALGYGD